MGKYLDSVGLAHFMGLLKSKLLPSGGSAGQVLAKTGATDYAVGWTSVSSGGVTTTWYGTCSTTASTTAKVVTCSGFSLSAGAIVGVLFTTANTSATPTLNVNSTGAKSIYVGTSTPDSTTNVLKWSANTMVYFMYDGTYFRYITSMAGGDVQQPRGAATWYATSTTAADTAAKVASVSNFVLTRGAVVAVRFTYANTYAGLLTLNVNSTGAKDVYYGTNITSSTNALVWEAYGGTTVTFVYSGSGWYVVAIDKPSGLSPVAITFANLCSDTWHYSTLGSLVGARGLYTTGDVTYSDIRTAAQSTEPAAFINRLKDISPFDVGNWTGFARFDLYIEPGVQNDMDPSRPSTTEHLHVLMTDTDGETYQDTVEFDYYRYTAIDNDFGGWEYDAKYGEVIPVANGGTGSSTASGARANLDVPALAASTNTYAGSQILAVASADTTKADNDVTTNIYRIFGSKDSNDHYITFTQTCVYTDGGTSVELASRNYGTGSNVTNLLRLRVNNDGSREVYVTEKAPWWAGLGLDTWTTVALSDFATAATGWAFATSSCNIQYNAALKALRVRIQIAPSAAQTAGQKTIFTVKTDYRPKTFAASLSSLTSYAQAGQIYTSGSFAVNIIATPASTNLYFNGVYFIGA